MNVWRGAANFGLATVTCLGLAYLGLYDTFSLPLILLGFWLMVLDFGFSIRRFASD